MKITINWLNEYVDLAGLSVEDLAHGLTMAGLEVEAVLPIGRELESLMVGKILEVRKHPQADRLTICRVDMGRETLDLVCGAPNVRPEILVPVALPGACLPSGMEVQMATIRGIVSPGMICSEKEMGLSEDHSGIMILPEGISVGLPISRALALEDTLLEVNVTPNRGDCLSHIGIAREDLGYLQSLLNLSGYFCRPFGQGNPGRDFRFNFGPGVLSPIRGPIDSRGDHRPFPCLAAPAASFRGYPKHQ